MTLTARFIGDAKRLQKTNKIQFKWIIRVKGDQRTEHALPAHHALVSWTDFKFSPVYNYNSKWTISVSTTENQFSI